MIVHYSWDQVAVLIDKQVLRSTSYPLPVHLIQTKWDLIKAAQCSEAQAPSTPAMAAQVLYLSTEKVPSSNLCAYVMIPSSSNSNSNLSPQARKAW